MQGMFLTASHIFIQNFVIYQSTFDTLTHWFFILTLVSRWEDITHISQPGEHTQRGSPICPQLDGLQIAELGF